MSRQKAHDEVFCASCGEAIKKQAELCPRCGVRNQEASRTASISVDKSTWSPKLADINQSTDVDVDRLVKYSARGLAWIFGVMFILAGLGSLFSGVGIVGWFISFLQGLVYIAIGSILLPPVRERISLEYPITTMGWTRSTGEAIVRNSDEPCSVCYDSINKGVARTYRDQFVLFGAPLFTRDEGSNKYCRNCASGEPSVETID